MNRKSFLRTCLFAFTFVSAALLSQKTYAAYPLGTETVFYHFEDAATATSTNSGSSGTTNDGTLSGNASTTAVLKRFGSRSAVFGETGDYMRTYYATGTNPTTQSISVSMWVNKNNNNCTSDDDHVFGVSGSPTNNRFYIRCKNSTTNKWGYRIQGNTEVLSGTISAANWDHIVLVADASADSARYYVNGTAVGSAVAYTTFTLPGNFYIGNYADTVAADLAQGAGAYIDEVAIYNTALSAGDVTTLYKAGDLVAPVISSIASSTTSTTASITWTTDESASTQVEYGLTASYGSLTTEIDTTTFITNHTAPITGLTAGTLYHYRVISRDPTGTVSSSSDQTFTTSAAPDTTAPVISNIASSTTATTATITWDTNESSTSTVNYGLTSSYGTASTSASSVTSPHTIVLSGLTANTTYHFQVASGDASQNVATSSDLTFKTSIVTPGQPTSLAATPYEGRVYLTWTAATSTFDDYLIEYKLSADSIWTTFTDGVSTATNTIVTGLVNNSGYDFRVAATNAGTPGATSSIVSATPIIRVSFLSPTPSNSAVITGSSVTVSASTTLPSASYASSTQILRLETSGGSLVSQVSTTTRFGDYNLTHLTNTLADSDLSLTGNSSGIAYVQTTDSLFIVHNAAVGSNATIDEVNKNGSLIKTITCTSCGDIESIVLISSVASTTAGGFDHTFMIGTENNTTSAEIFRVVINSAVTTTVNRLDYYNTGITHAANGGLEGIAYNPANGLYYVARELSTPALYEVKLGVSHAATATQICTNLSLGSTISDYSDLVFRNNTLFALSENTNPSKLVPIDITSTSTCGLVDSNGNSIASSSDTADWLGSLAVGVTDQAEGVVWDDTGDTLYVLGEADFLAKYRSNVFTSQHTFTGLADGNYVLKASFVDSNGITSSSTSRSFTILNDSTAPVISSIASTTSSTTASFTWTTNEAASSSVRYGLTTSYGTVASSSATSSHSVSLTGLSSDTVYHFQILAIDASGNISTSSDGLFITADGTAPGISSIFAFTASTSASISWGTNESATSSVQYGLTTSYGSISTSTPGGNTIHAVSLASLTPSTLYHYRILAVDGFGNVSTSSDQTFTTTDGVGPVISNIASSTGDTSAAITWATDENASSSVRYGLTTSYGSVASSSQALLHGATISGLTDATTYHFSILAIDAFGNVSTSSDQTFTTTVAPDATAPVISSVSGTTVNSTSVTIQWITNENASSWVQYGVNENFGSVTSETDTSPRVTSHSVTLSGLYPCTLYSFRVRSTDASSNTSTSSTATVSTNGCTGSSDVLSQSVEQVATSTGGDVDLTSGGSGVNLDIPVGYYGTSSLTFQIKKIEKDETISATNLPDVSLSVVGDHIYDFKAFSGVATIVTSFNAPITVTLTYTAAQIANINESTLVLKRWDGTWHDLTGCVVNTTAKTVTCTTTGFSIFGLFGVVLPSATTPVSNGSWTGPTGGSSGGYVTTSIPVVISTPAPTIVPVVVKIYITKQLRKNMTDKEVLLLQKALNLEVTTRVAATGAGSKGKETTLYGNATDAALKKFQLKYGIVKSSKDTGYGVVGPATRAKLNAVISTAVKNGVTF